MKYCFGAFELEPRERRLFRDGEEIHLQPKTLDTLILLIERRGHLVSKDDLMNELWPDQVVTDHSITRCIREVRKALNDNPAKSRYIETIPKAGYRFVAQVREKAGSEIPSPTPAFISRRAWTIASMVAVVFLLGLSTWKWINPSTPLQDNVVPVLAILPFENGTGSDEYDLVLAGLAQDIRERLASSGRVAVTSGVSVSALGSVSPDLSGWPEALNADWLLRGSMQETEKFRSISMQLVSSTDVPGWKQEVQIISGDLIGLSEKISAQVAGVLGFTLPRQPRFLATAASVDSINAHHQYLLARGLIAQRNPENVNQAIRVLHEVLEIMPNHANAMAALGIAYILGPNDLYPVGVALDRAEALFTDALEIDPDTALAWAGRALAQAQLETNLELQVHYIEKALQLNPFDADVLGWAAYAAGSEGRIDDAFDYFQRALVVDPLHTSVNGNLSFNLAKQGRYDQAMALLDNASVRLGNHPSLYYFKVSIASNTGDWESALVLAQEAMADWPDSVFFAGQLAGVYASLQMRDEAERWIHHAMSRREPNEQALGAKLGVAFRFGTQAAIRQTIAQLYAHPGFDDDDPQASTTWILSHLVAAHGYLGDCGRLEEAFDHLYENPESLEGRRGTIVYVSDLAQWKAWCLLEAGKSGEALAWLDWVTDRFNFMKQRGLGAATTHMRVEAQNLALRGQDSEAIEVLRSMMEIGWKDPGLLEHDPRWDTLRNSQQFADILEAMADSTDTTRTAVIEKGLVADFERAFTDSM